MDKPDVGMLLSVYKEYYMDAHNINMVDMSSISYCSDLL